MSRRTRRESPVAIGSRGRRCCTPSRRAGVLRVPRVPAGHESVGAPLGDTCIEIGTLEAYSEHTSERFASRPFNRITTLPDGSILKEPVDAQGESLAALEQDWYRQASRAGLACLPEIRGYDPLRMELIPGREPYHLEPSEGTLAAIVGGLRELHAAYPTVPAEVASLDVRVSREDHRASGQGQ